MKTTRIELSYQAIIDLLESSNDIVYPQKALMECQRYEIDYMIENPNYSALLMNSQKSISMRMIVIQNLNGLYFRVGAKDFDINYPRILNFSLDNNNKISINDMSKLATNPLDKQLLKTSDLIIKEEGKDEMLFMVNLFGRILEYLKKPKRVVEVSSHKREVNTPNKSNKKSNKKKKVQYVYDTLYKVNRLNIEEPKEKKNKSSEEKTEREYFKEEWIRNGHYRHYRNEDGSIRKKVWIPQTVVHVKGKTKETRDIKITRVTK